jgi:hypothetical protein
LVEISRDRDELYVVHACGLDHRLIQARYSICSQPSYFLAYSQDFAGNVVISLQSRLAQASEKFKNVLEVFADLNEWLGIGCSLEDVVHVAPDTDSERGQGKARNVLV